MSNLYRSVIEDDPALLAEIGRTTIVWSLVSRCLQEIVSRHGTRTEQASFFKNGSDFNRIEKATALWKREAQMHPRYNEMLKGLAHLKSLVATRNQIIHGLPSMTRSRGSSLDIPIVSDPRDPSIAGQPSLLIKLRGII